MAEDAEAQPDGLACPHCGQPLAPPESPASAILCRHCGEEVSLIAGDEPAEEPPEDQDDELSGMRIRQLVVMRRSAVRARSYCLIAVITCVVGVVQFAINAIYGWRARGAEALLAWLQAALALVCVSGAIFFSRKLLTYHRELQKRPLDEPDTPPDFTTLSDGSQHWQALERMQDDKPNDDPTAT